MTENEQNKTANENDDPTNISSSKQPAKPFTSALSATVGHKKGGKYVQTKFYDLYQRNTSVFTFYHILSVSQCN